MSTTIFTSFDSNCSSASPGSSSTRSSMYENPEQPPPLTPTRRRVLSAGRLWSAMIDLISLATDSLSVIVMGQSPVGLLVVLLAIQTFERHVDPPTGQNQVRHANGLQKLGELQLQRLYRPVDGAAR